MDGAQLKQVTIYTDGACNPMHEGVGGYGVILIHDGKSREISGGFRATTNNRMEIYAAIRGLEALKFPCKVTLFSDSQYLVTAMINGWAAKWKSNNWKRGKDERVANKDLWERLLSLCELHQVEFQWRKRDDDDFYSSQCHKLSTDALTQKDLPADDGYETTPRISRADTKITYEGQACRKCSTPVIKRIPKKRPKSAQSYFYEYYFYCPGCHTMYMVDEAKRSVNK